MVCANCSENAQAGAKFCNACGKAFKPLAVPPMPASYSMIANANEAQKMALMMVVTTGRVDPRDLAPVEKACYIKGVIEGLKPSEIGRKYMFFVESMVEFRQKEALLYFARMLSEYTPYGPCESMVCPECRKTTEQYRCRHQCNNPKCQYKHMPWIVCRTCTECGAVWNRFPWWQCYAMTSQKWFWFNIIFSGLIFWAIFLSGPSIPRAGLPIVLFFWLILWLPFLAIRANKAKGFRAVPIMPGGIGLLAG